MSALSDFHRRTFAALAIPNFRRYAIGHTISVTGIWMQRIAQSWLVLELTGSGTAMGVVTALQFAPIWFVAPWGGLLADRVDRRRLLIATQSAAATIALALGIVVMADLVELWMVFVMALALGIVGSVDNPTRQALVPLLVGSDRITNALGLNVVLVNVSRILGPAIAGALIVSVGIGACFIIDAASYLAMIIALVMIRIDPEVGEPDPEGVDLGPGFRVAISEARRNRDIGVALFMIAGISAFTNQFETTLPLMARFAFGGDADTFGVMFAVMGGGAAVGGLAIASRRVVSSGAAMSNLAAATGVVMVGVALAPNLSFELLGLFAVGGLMTALLVQANSTLQMSAPPQLMGRVMALHALALLGMRPLFSPVLGWMGDTLGPRSPLLAGAGGAILVSVLGRLMVSRGPLPAERS